jgi:hypothetical protein
MELPSNTALLLRGFDTWVVDAHPTCDDASRVLRCLQRALSQTKAASHPMIPSIPVLLRHERFGRPVGGSFQITTLPMDTLLF